MKSVGRRSFVVVGVVAILVGLALGFAWGFASYRYRVFPYWQVRRAAMRFAGSGHTFFGERYRYRNSPSPAVREAAELAALGYVEGTVDAESEKRGVTLHDRGRAHRGVNLYTSHVATGAILIDMDGEVLHRWEAGELPWYHVSLLDDGSVIALSRGEELKRVSASGEVLWRTPGRFHHDFAVAADGAIWALERREVELERYGGHRVMVDVVTVLDPRGGRVRELSLLDGLEASSFSFLLPSFTASELERPRTIDVFHANHVELVERDAGSFRAGDLVISMRALNALVCLEGATGGVRWVWGPSNLTWQHHPTVLENGNLLVFDNGTKRSRVLELVPGDWRIVWRYGPRPDFFSKTRGSAQRLANGNTLITESDTGYAFEVTPEGEKVWELANPDVTWQGVRRAIWRVTRLPVEAAAFLDGFQANAPTGAP